MTVTAEGVETEAQRAFLRGGCDQVQGLLDAGPPMPLAAFEDWACRAARPARRGGYFFALERARPARQRSRLARATVSWPGGRPAGDRRAGADGGAPRPP